MRLLLFLTLLLLSLPAGIFAEAPHPPYAVARISTPVLNTPAFAAVFGGKDGATLKLDRCGQIREVEFIALPGTVFRIEGELRQGKATIYRVTSGDYPYPAKTGYYIDSRFVTTIIERPPERPRWLPDRQTITDRLLAAEGKSYVWGGNVSGGVPEIRELYPPASGVPHSAGLDQQWELAGLDCSGLLYEATGGFTPRNTSALVRYGTDIPISGLTASEIARKVEPLDLIVWEGHVQIVLDRGRLIESRLECGGKGGVIVRPLREALADLVRHRKPLDDYGTGKGKGFVLRRWFPAEP
ncbi:peptidoglycan endopeptidase [Geomobilimonas luticola]|uniref:Peptidoglycan endopeptidase n=1 Tax=Geomobilimonas luticola TaxID=1114878 RepID=A0ABS5S7X6_9BACT|nr:peptidoglycan endopeptidase [Geomobilimonas luticola]MBT0651468.1 peptidoglycan endopeptidase [Geomobilimonas luticola]